MLNFNLEVKLYIVLHVLCMTTDGLGKRQNLNVRKYKFVYRQRFCLTVCTDKSIPLFTGFSSFLKMMMI